MWRVFAREYLPESPGVRLVSYETTTTLEGASIRARLHVDGEPRFVQGEGNGPVAALVHALKRELGIEIEVLDFAEHAVTAGTDAGAVAYVEAKDSDGKVRWGAGMDNSILTASLRAVLGAVNRLRKVPV